MNRSATLMFGAIVRSAVVASRHDDNSTVSVLVAAARVQLAIAYDLLVLRNCLYGILIILAILYLRTMIMFVACVPRSTKLSVYGSRLARLQCATA